MLIRTVFLLAFFALSCGSSTGGDDVGSDISEPQDVATDTSADTAEGDADAGTIGDDGSSSEPDLGNDPDEGTADTGTVEPEWNWTWLDCRRAFLEETLSDEDQALCANYYSSAPQMRRFGIHWIFLGHDDETVETYPESQMEDLNEIYADSNMEFFIHSRQKIVDPVAVEGATGETVYLVGDLISDLRQYLGTDEDDPQLVLDLLQERMEANGVVIGQGSNPSGGLTPRAKDLSLDTEWTAADIHGRVARLNNEFITVIVRQAAGEKSWGHYPRAGTTNPLEGLIYLASPTALSALPHEVGHFFGLPHTHGVWNSQAASTQEWKVSTLMSYDDEDWAGLQALAGEDYSDSFEDVLVPFDGLESDVEAFEKAQILARRVLAWSDLTYVGDFLPVASDAEFISMVRAATPPFMKNFVRTTGGEGSFSGNNCRKSYVGDDQTTVRCKYGDDGDEPLHVLYGDHPILFETVLFGESTEANLMSYISTDTSDGVRRKKHLTQRQRDVIRLGTQMPSRLRLRNYALFD